MKYKILFIFLLSTNFLLGFEFRPITSFFLEKSEKFLKTRGLASIEKQLLKNARYISFGGKLVAKRNSTFYPYIRDAQGRTNIERMKSGLAPIGKDGLPVELHHLKQQNDGIIVELTSTEHRSNYKVLHRYENVSKIDRKEFNKWKREYWKERAKDFE